MVGDIKQSDSELLEIEERQLFYFLTDVRPVGEEKSELYPEPQYFNTAFISVASLLPDLIDKIEAKTGDAKGYARVMKKVLAPATALQMSGLAFLTTWGREMWLLDEPGADLVSGVITTHANPTLSNAETARVLRFSDNVVRIYREDGEAYPNATGALGDNYRILSEDKASQLAAGTEPISTELARDILGLLAAVRAISFLMEAETREALMMHGPYPTGDDGEQLIIFECNDLNWSLFPNFPISGGVRWALPETQFPVANLAIAFVVKDAKISSDRFGTIYVDPLSQENIVSAALLSRGENALIDNGLEEIPLSEAASLRRLCDEIQEFMFLQIATWELRQRMEAGVYQEHMLLLRMLSAAGYSADEIEVEQHELFERSAPTIQRYFEKCLNRTVEELPFYGKLGAFAAGQSKALFTPLLATRR